MSIEHKRVIELSLIQVFGLPLVGLVFSPLILLVGDFKDLIKCVFYACALLGLLLFLWFVGQDSDEYYREQKEWRAEIRDGKAHRFRERSLKAGGPESTSGQDHPESISRITMADAERCPGSVPLNLVLVCISLFVRA